MELSQTAIEHFERIFKAAIAVDSNADDTRKAEATSLVKSGLILANITETPQIDKLIDTVIPILVLALPKTHEDTVTFSQNPVVVNVTPSSASAAVAVLPATNA